MCVLLLLLLLLVKGVVPEKLRMRIKRKEVTKALPWHWAI